MKVLIIPAWYPSHDSPGEGVFIQQQAKALQAAGHEVVVMYADLKFSNWIKVFQGFLFRRSFKEEEGLSILRLNGFLFPKSNPLIRPIWICIYQSLFNFYHQKKGLPDVIHAHSFLAGIAAYDIAKPYNIPIVLTEHLSSLLDDSLKKKHVSSFKNILNKADALVAVSKGLKTKMQTYTSQEIKVIPNLVDTDFFSPLPKEAKRDDFTFIAIGSLIPRKGFDLLIQAFAKIKKTSDLKPRLIIIGDGREKSNLLKLIEKLGLKDKVNLTGHLSQEKVKDQLRRADVFVLSSHIETFGVVVIEAMAVGLPIIATRCIGTRDLINEKVGYYIEPNNIDELVHSMNRMIHDAVNFDQQFIRNRTIEKYGKEVVAKEITELYQSLVNRHQTKYEL